MEKFTLFTDSQQTEGERFNMTPVIDIVFLLIIFFMLVCQFIVAENFEVAVPDGITTAAPDDADDDQITTVTVMFDENRGVGYAVGAEQIETTNSADISSAIAARINKQLQNLPPNRRVVCLRVDKDICFADSQSAIVGVSQSTATDMKLAVVNHKQGLIN